MPSPRRTAARSVLAGFLAAAAAQAAEQPLPHGITEEALAKDNTLFLTLAKKALHWEEPAEPIKIVGPLYFVGTRGLSVFLFTTPEVLMNTGMPSSGPIIVDSIKKLGFKPEDIKIMINGHAHIDHAGAFAWLKQQTGAELAVMREDVRSGDGERRQKRLQRRRFRLFAGQGRSHLARRRHDQDR
jgi:metallo-beta-lactamase class B